MLGTRHGQSGYTVIAIAENLYPKTLVLLCYLVEASKELVQGLDQVTGRQLLRQRSEIDNVRIEDGHVVVSLHVELMEPGLLATDFLARVCHLQHYAALHLKEEWKKEFALNFQS